MGGGEGVQGRGGAAGSSSGTVSLLGRPGGPLPTFLERRAEGPGARGQAGVWAHKCHTEDARCCQARASPVFPGFVLSRTSVFLGLCLSFILFLCVRTSLSHCLLEFLLS